NRAAPDTPRRHAGSTGRGRLKARERELELKLTLTLTRVSSTQRRLGSVLTARPAGTAGRERWRRGRSTPTRATSAAGRGESPSTERGPRVCSGRLPPPRCLPVRRWSPSSSAPLETRTLGSL